MIKNLKKAEKYSEENEKMVHMASQGLFRFITRYSAEVYMMLSQKNIMFLTVEQYEDSIEKIVYQDEYKYLDGKYLIYLHYNKKGYDRFLVIDNEDNECYMEDFRNLEVALLWLKYENMDLETLFALEAQMNELKKLQAE